MSPPSFCIYATTFLVCLVAVGGLALAGTALVRTNNVYALTIAGAAVVGIGVLAATRCIPGRRPSLSTPLLPRGTDHVAAPSGPPDTV